MKSKLGVYIISLGSFDAVNYFRRAQPRIALSMDHNPDHWKALKKVSPNTFVIGRYYLDDEDQLFEDDPEGRAEQFFQMMKPDADKMRGIYDAWMSYNEIPVHSVNTAQALSRFHVRWGDLMREAKLVSCAYSFATGNPELEYWEHLAEGLRHCDLLSLHEYSAPTMDRDQSWLCLRYRRAMNALPADARRPIVITETGIDGGTLPDPAQAQKGWTFFTDEAGYLATLKWYDSELQKDDYVLGAAIFAVDGWGINGSFGIGRANQIRDYIAQGGAPPPIVIQPPAPSTVEQAAIAAAKKLTWMPINTEGALYRFAQANNLGYPQTDEFEVTFNNIKYVGQVYNGGIVYVKAGDWGNVKWVTKPQTSPEQRRIAMDWCPFATKRPIVAENFQAGRGGKQVKAVVLHIAAGPLTAVFPTFNNPARGVSAHFCIGKKGEIEQYVSVNDTAFANGLRWDAAQQKWICPHNNIVNPSWQDLTPPDNPNLYTISIEHEGMPEEKWTDAMYDANQRLLLWLAEQFNLIYVVRRTLIGHHEIDPVDKPNCPGPNVEWDRMIADLTAINAARQLTWMPINTTAALYQFAQTNNLGYPQTDEFEFTFSNDAYVGQVFNLGIVYVKKGDWGNIRWIKKPT